MKEFKLLLYKCSFTHILYREFVNVDLFFPSIIIRLKGCLSIIANNVALTIDSRMQTKHLKNEHFFKPGCYFKLILCTIYEILSLSHDATKIINFCIIPSEIDH